MSYVDMIPWKTKEMEKIAKIFLTDKKLILLRAPAGIGKTSVAVAYLISMAIMGKRGAIFLRTRKEVEHTLAIIKRIISGKKLDLLILPTPSKHDFCVVKPGVPLIKYWCPASECDRLKRRKYSDIEKVLRSQVFSELNSYVRLMAMGMRCPYHICLELLKKADIIIGTHPYFIHEDLFERLGKLAIIVVDEAHNLVGITTFEGDAKNIEEGKIIAEEAMEKGHAIHKYVVRLWRSGDIDRATILAEYDAYRTEKGVEVRMNGKIIKVYPPIELVKDRIENVSKIILMSSTLYPSKFYEKLFAEGINHRLEVIPGLFKSPKRRIVIMDTELSTAVSMRSQEIYAGYASEIKRLHRKLGEKIIVFCPSYEVAKNIAKHLGKEVKDKPEGEIIITVYRGRIAEGVELPEGYKVAIMAGLPFPKISAKDEKIIEVYSKIYRIDKQSIRQAFLMSSMVSALIQAAGRVGRREQGIVIIIDSRAKSIFGGAL